MYLEMLVFVVQEMVRKEDAEENQKGSALV